ncbi:S-layer homology domain-containing protein [Agathobaculum sp.]|uniref:S-layer homology domain-containing protein n=2 Tax=Agathobaculum TaxID=2048137 RepID=UPI003A8F7F98
MMKTGKNNRFLASILAASMMLTMSPFAFAADETEQKEMTTQEQVQSAAQNETNANPAVSQMDSQSSEGTNSEALKTEGQSPKDTSSEAPKTEDQSSKDVKPADENTTAGDSTSTSKTPAESENPTESETPTKPEAPKNAAKIGENEYPTVAAAIAAADGSESIVLLRDVTENITINKSLTLNLGGFTLSGDANAAVVTISGDKPQVTVKNGTVTGGRNPQNGGGFAIDSAVVQLEDLTITGNEAVGGNGNGEVGGGGIYASHADVSMRIVTVSENSVTGSSSDGGGILVRYGSLTMDGCHVERNTAPDCGGGMILRHSVLNAAKSFFENNTAKFGAGIYFGDTPNEAEEGCSGEHNHLITDSTISGNTVLDPENGIGGGMYVGTTSNLTLRNSKLLNNDGATQGGAIVAYSAGTIELDGVSISENKAQSGAGILALCTAVCNTDIRLLNGTAIDANTATGYGGGIYANAIAKELNVTVTNSSVSGNTAAGGAGIFTYKSGSAVINVDLQSGAVMHDNNAVVNMGGAIYAYNAANINIAANSAVYNNTAAGYGGGIYASASNINIAANSEVYNNTAATAGDDLFFYSGTIFTLPNAKDMSGDRILSSDNMEITGWYHDGWNKWNAAQGSYEQIGCWTAETADEYIPVEKDSHAISLKAAHPLMYTLTYDVTGDLPEGYTAPAKQTLVKGSSYTVAEVPASVSGSKDGVNGTFSFNGWKKDDGTVLTGEQQLTADLTLHGVWSFTKKSSGGGGGGSHKPTVTIPDDVPTGLNGDDHFAYIVGYPNGNVEPNGNITRAEVATIFFRLLTEEVRTANSTQSNSLSDVTRGQWFNHAVSTLSSMGIVKGHNDGTFAPNAPITRAEFAAIAARFDDKNTDTSSKFTDIASHWAKNEIGIAANKGWINGYPDDTFRPNQYITRAEAMTLVNRVLNRLPENSSDLLDSMIKWPDNSDASAWYYLAVQEATNSHAYSDKSKDDKYEKWTTIRDARDWTELEK